MFDGDTLDIHGQPIRLHGIDAPESRQTCLADGERWRCGQQAALALVDKIDRYGRIVAVCSVGGEDVGAFAPPWEWRRGERIGSPANTSVPSRT